MCKSKMKRDDLIKIFSILYILVISVCIIFLLRNFINYKIEKNVYYQRFLPSKEMEIFYKGSPKKGIYINYLKKISVYCIKLLKQIKDKKNKAIVIDFDDTLVWTKPYKPEKLKYLNSVKYGRVFYFSELIYISNILRYAKKEGFYIFVITSRPPCAFMSTSFNMEKYKIPYDAIFTSSFFGEHPIFKANIRRKIEKFNPKEIKGLNTFQLLSKKIKKCDRNCTQIVMSVGDNWYDIYDGNVEIGIKLPSPNDFNSYIYHNNRIVDLI